MIAPSALIPKRLRMMRRGPPLHPETLAELERRGVPAMTATLLRLAEHDGMGLPLKPEHQVAFELRETDAGAVCVTRRELETWLAWKSAGDSRWIKTEVGAAVVAAILAVFAWLLPLK